MSQQIKIIEKKVNPILTQVTNLKIVDVDTLTFSAGILAQAKNHLNALIADKKLITDPMKASLKEVESRYAPIESTLKEIIEGIRIKQSAYQTLALKAQKEAEEKIASRIGTGSGKLKFETAVAKIEGIEKPLTNVSTSLGKLSFRTDKKLRIVNSADIPREYLLPNESLILSDIKNGKQIPGCEIEEIQVPISRRV